jgi:hypothetical protein
MVLGDVAHISGIHVIFVFVVEGYGEFLCKFGVLSQERMGDDRRGTNPPP